MEIILTPEELQSLGLRNSIIGQKQAELQIISREKELYQRDLLQKYELDVSKKYSIDPRGVISLVEGAKNGDDKGTGNDLIGEGIPAEPQAGA